MIFSTVIDNLENSSEKMFLYGLYACHMQISIVKIYSVELWTDKQKDG